MRRQRTEITELMCIFCGGIFPISRKASRLKSENHIKHLWCISCKKETEHVEKLRKKSEVRRYRGANSKDVFGDDDATDWDKIFGIY